jgi:hypothetical protein
MQRLPFDDYNDPAQMKVLDDALAPGKVSGKRYADWIMATIDR